jgi:hypothetical protein
VAAVAFSALNTRPLAVELGVLRGENARTLLDVLNPSRLLLVDSWSASLLARHYSPFDELPPWVMPVTEFGHYFGGPMTEQTTFDRLHHECVTRFIGEDRVQVLRGDTIAEFGRIRQALPTGAGVDLLYVDANHQYEFVYRELMHYAELWGPESLIMLNDCCHSRGGLRQNLGVLEAVSGFVKHGRWQPIALTATDYSDVVLARPGSTMADVFGKTLERSKLPYVELPHQLLPAARVVYGADGHCNISFV